MSNRSSSPGILGIIHHMSTRISNKTKASGSLRLRILHNDNIYDFSPLLEVFLKRVICRSIIQAADEQLSHVFRLIFTILKY